MAGTSVGWGRSEDVTEVLFDEATIRKRVQQLAAAITADYAPRWEENPRWSLKVVGVLRGAVFFVTDLVRAIPLPVTVDFMALSAYRSPGRVQILKDLEDDIEEQDVLLVEDIIDTGLTMRYLLRQLSARGPRSLHVAAFVDRSGLRLAGDLPIKYTGFDVQDLFVVGYGLDFKERYRNLPYIGVLKDEIMTEHFEGPRFAHPSEVEFAQFLDFYKIRWEYEPRQFTLREDANGQVEVGFSPDFYLPEFDLYIEVTTKKPHLMSRKLRQIEAMRQQYPEVRVELLTRTDFAMLAAKLRG